MREISFVKRLKFNFNGSVTKKALVIGDADNDQGDLAIFKKRNQDRYAYATDLGMVTACVIGDVINAGQNYVAAINTEGWLFIYNVPNLLQVSQFHDNNAPPTSPRDGSTPTEGLASGGGGSGGVHQQKADAPTMASQTATDGESNHKTTPNRSPRDPIKLKSLYEQRMPANCKELLLADLDGDGNNEIIVGLTDRVLRTYKWIQIGPDRGKFVGLYKWEFADQIGAVSLNPSRHENCQDIIVAQPGGTYAKLECFDKKPTILPDSMISNSQSDHQYSPDTEPRQENSGEQDKSQTSPAGGSSNDNDDNVRTEYISKLTPEYHQLALAQMRNHHISTEILGGIRDGKNSKSYSLIVIATLDGTLMLVNKDEILWSLQVDHQLFALAILESKKQQQDDDDDDDDVSNPQLSQSESTCTIVPIDGTHTASVPSNLMQETIRQVGSNRNRHDDNVNSSNISQYFVVCAWNGKTYIIDEERNYLRFKFDEAVSAFTAGNYYFDDCDHASLVYATFNNQIVLYFDVLLDHIRPLYLLDEVMLNPDNADILEGLEALGQRLRSLANDNNDCKDDPANVIRDESEEIRLHGLLEDLLYGIADTNSTTTEDTRSL